MFDLAIIGAGPAGATLARMVAPSMKVLLLERRRLDLPAGEAGLRKCCGGLLNPDAQRELARQGIALPKSVLCEPQPFMVRALDLDSGLERRYQRSYVNMDREKFDRFLFSMAVGCNVRTGASVIDVRYIDGVYEIEYMQEGKRQKERAAMVAAADGGASLLRRRFDRQKGAHFVGTAPSYAAIQERLEMGAGFWDSYGAFFSSKITDYYGWAIPKDGQVVFGAALAPGKFATTHFERLKSALINRGIPLTGKVIAREGALLQRPRGYGHLLSSVGRMAFLGEAGGFISPSSSEGVSWALRTAAALAGSLNASGDIDAAIADYARKTVGMKLYLCAAQTKSWAIYNPATRHLALKSGVTAIR